jgi:hypothetical protein
MNFALLVAMVAILLLVLRAICVRNLSASELAQLKAISCPICRKNLQTIMALYVLVRSIHKLEKQVTKRLHYGLSK